MKNNFLVFARLNPLPHAMLFAFSRAASLAAGPRPCDILVAS